MNLHLDDTSLLTAFHNHATKEKGYNGIVKKYQEKLYWLSAHLMKKHPNHIHLKREILAIQRWLPLYLKPSCFFV